MPSDNKYNPTHKSKWSTADHNFAKAAKDKLFQLYGHTPNSPRELLEAKAKTLTMTVRQHILPVLQAGGGFDKDALEATLFTMFVQGFDSTMFTKEELIHLCATLHAQALMESIDKDPWGKGKPDLLAGGDDDKLPTNLS